MLRRIGMLVGCFHVCDWLNTDLTDLADAMRVDAFKQKQNKNSLWAYSHASSC